MTEKARAAFLLPLWLALGVFFLAPLVLMLAVSFAERGTYGGVAPVGDLGAYLRSGAFLANYARSCAAIYLAIGWRSLWMAALTTVLAAVAGFPVAYYLALLAPARWKGLLLGLVMVPFWTSFLIRTYAWMFILRTEGLLNLVLLGSGLAHRPVELLYTQTAVMIGLVYGELPFMILPLYASLEKLDRSLLEAAADLGAGAAQAFRRVTLPLVMPGLAAGVVLVFVPSLGQFVVSDLLGGARGMLLGNLIQNQFAVARNPPFGSALAFELMAAVLAPAARLRALRPASGRRRRRGAAVTRPKGAGRRLLAAHTALVYAFLYAPIAILVAFSFNASRQTAFWAGFTLDWYRRLLANAELFHAVRNSLVVAAAATVIAVLLGTPAALALAQSTQSNGSRDFRGKRATQALLYLPVIIPEVVLGAALVTFFGAVGLRLSIATVVIAHVVFSVSYVAIVVRARLAGLDPALAEAARDLGAGPFETFRRVTLPLAAPGILAAALLVFTLSIDDYVVTSFVAGVGATTLPLHIYSMLKVGVTPEVNAVSSLLLAGTIVLIVAAHRLLGKGSS